MPTDTDGKDETTESTPRRPLWQAPALMEYGIVGSTESADGLSDDGFSGLES